MKFQRLNLKEIQTEFEHLIPLPAEWGTAPTGLHSERVGIPIGWVTLIESSVKLPR